MEAKEFGEYFVEIRKREGYKSQRDLADKSGISNATISRLESGVTKTTPEVLRELANCFISVTYEELMQNAGYLNIESAVDEFKDVYNLSKKFGHRFSEVAHLMRFCKIYTLGRVLQNYLQKRKVELNSVAENIDISLIDLREIIIGKKDIPLEPAIKLAMFYKFPFVETFRLEASFIVSDEPFDEELLLIRIDILIEEELQEISNRQTLFQDIPKVVDADVKSGFTSILKECSEDEINFLFEQLLLFRKMNLKKDGLKIK